MTAILYPPEMRSHPVQFRKTVYWMRDETMENTVLRLQNSDRDTWISSATTLFSLYRKLPREQQSLLGITVLDPRPLKAQGKFLNAIAMGLDTAPAPKDRMDISLSTEKDKWKHFIETLQALLLDTSAHSLLWRQDENGNPLFAIRDGRVQYASMESRSGHGGQVLRLNRQLAHNVRARFDAGQYSPRVLQKAAEILRILTNVRWYNEQSAATLIVSSVLTILQVDDGKITMTDEVRAQLNNAIINIATALRYREGPVGESTSILWYPSMKTTDFRCVERIFEIPNVSAITDVFRDLDVRNINAQRWTRQIHQDVINMFCDMLLSALDGLMNRTNRATMEFIEEAESARAFLATIHLIRLATDNADTIQRLASIGKTREDALRRIRSEYDVYTHMEYMHMGKERSEKWREYIKTWLRQNDRKQLC